MTQLLDIKEDTPLAIRDKAIMELFYSSGLRLSELAGLRWDQIDPASGLITVTGKGNKTRVVPVGSYAAKALAHGAKSGAISPVSKNPTFSSATAAPRSRPAPSSPESATGPANRACPSRYTHTC